MLKRHASALVTLLLFLTPCMSQAQIIGSSRVYKVVMEGKTLQLEHFESLDPNCRSVGPTEINLLTEPKGGHIFTKQGTAFPTFPATNIHFHCDQKRAPSTLLLYRADTGYLGPDTFDVEALYPEGLTRKFRLLVFVR